MKESQLKKIVFEEYNKLIKEGYVPSSAFNNFAKADESGILVANEKLSDFISYVENTPGVFENLPPMLKEMYQDAKNYFNAYPHLDKNQKPMKENIMGIPSEEEYYINIMVPRIKSWMDEVYEDWGGLDAVSPEALTDFSNRNDYEETLDTFAHEFNVNKELLKPLLDKSIRIAHNQLKDELLGEGIVNKFTPYTPEEKARNFEYLRTGFGRSPEERNPSYAKAKKEAEERRRQRELQKKNESKRHINISKNDITEAIKQVLKEYKTNNINEDGYSYNGLDQQAQYRKMGEDLMAQQQREKNYKKNMALFKKAFNKVYKEFSIIGTIKRKSPESKEVFNGPAFIKFVEHTEGDSLYTPIWEKYGGEYLEMANIYLESYIIKFRRKLGMD